MSALLNLPAELFQYLARPPPQSLLIRGEPGTGKTTFALGLLEQFPGRRFLVSTRVSPIELKAEFRWLDTGTGIHLIDAVRTPGDVRGAYRALGRVSELVAGTDHEPVARSLWLPPAIQEVWSQADSSAPSMVVVDSWDALVERYLGPPSHLEGMPDRAEIERLLLDQMGQGPVYTVLVTERAEISQLDYLVNAVVETRSEDHVSRPERWMYLRKLRGTRIDTPAYPYTLEGARFHCIGPLGHELLARPVRPEPEPSPMKGWIWPGSSDFASAFGRLPVGHLSLIERDSTVPTDSVILLVRPMAAQVALSGGRVLAMLPPSVRGSSVLRAYREYLTDEQMMRQLRFQLSGPSDDFPEELSRILLPSPTADPGGTPGRIPEAVRFMRELEPSGAPNLSVIWVSALRAWGAETGVEPNPATLPGIALNYLSGTPAHTVFVGVADDPLIVALRTMSSLRLRLKSTGARVFAWGEDPPTPSFVLSEGDEATGKPYRLTRIV
jgi:hypothetical protein